MPETARSFEKARENTARRDSGVSPSVDDASLLARLGEPRALWQAFFDLSAIPRPSHHEAAASVWALERARRLGHEAHADEAGNVLIKVAASHGREGAPAIALQAHLDMVPQREAGSAHDFLRDPIRPRLDPDAPGWLRASGTTLGADDGIGVAATFALLEDRKLVHGPLEVVLTVNEEDGMGGAKGLDPSFITAPSLINLDGEDEEEICVGSAGGSRLFLRFEEEAEAVEPGHGGLRLSVSGLRGGHSGCDIHLGRVSAIRLLARLLAEGGHEDGAVGTAAPDFRLASISGGSLPNAIAREAEAIIIIPTDRFGATKSDFENRVAAARKELADLEPGLAIALGETAKPERALSREAGRRMLQALASLPDGLESMMDGMPGIARLSSNLGALATKTTDSGRLLVEGRLLVRGAYDVEREGRVAKIREVVEGAGGRLELAAVTPGWQPDFGSPLLARAELAWKRALGRTPLIRVTHGGLECGVFRSKRPELSIVSVGPNIRFPHSPDEAVELASVARFYEALALLVAGT